MNQDQIIVTVGLLFVAVFYIANWRAKDAKGTGLHNGNKFSQPPNILSRPPGPKPDWLIGNIRQFPKGRLAETFTAWQRIYGHYLMLFPVMSWLTLILRRPDIHDRPWPWYTCREFFRYGQGVSCETVSYLVRSTSRCDDW